MVRSNNYLTSMATWLLLLGCFGFLAESFAGPCASKPDGKYAIRDIYKHLECKKEVGKNVTCRNGIYDPCSKKCVHLHQVNKAKFCRCRPDSNYNDPWDCHKFVTCSNNNVYFRDCAISSLVYDPSSDQCVYESKVECQREKENPVKPVCQAKVDVGFILDSSASMGNHYQKAKTFLKSTASVFDISKDNSQATVVTFSKIAELSIKLKDYTDISSFRTAVDNIPLMGSVTRIDLALRLTQREMFSTENGGRSGIPKLLILITDGSQTIGPGVERPGYISDELRESGIKILVVGIGRDTNKTELDHMAGGRGYSFNVTSFQELIGGSFINRLTAKVCDIVSGGSLANIVHYPLYKATYDGKGFGLNSGGFDAAEYQVTGKVTLKACLSNCYKKRKQDRAFNGAQYDIHTSSCYCEKNYVKMGKVQTEWLHYRLY